ncbi:SRPBCC family protein [Gordonia paraffinivorans]|uniref:SRPBCC family protein n=1 Tax=Gordonia paraffinivorans TaxID=175628 RepID=UPI001E55094E|nr:SRPBCC family protein [Gordonia paraffinivorans]MCD2144977.1 SRPBCC family protein [Gordonia paraffinivorans]
MVVAIVVVAIVAVLGGLVGLLVLRILARGENAHHRSRTAELSARDIPDYFDSTARFAVTATARVRTAPEDAFIALADGRHLESIPFVAGSTPIRARGQVGPVQVGEGRRIDTLVAALGERIVRAEPGRILVLTGTGVSIPMVLESFGERYTIDEIGDDLVDVSWTIAGTPRFIGFLPLRWAAPFLRPFLGFFLQRGLTRGSVEKVAG